MIDFTQYLPQRIFLMQGNELQYEHIHTAVHTQFPIVNALSVPRFTVEHAQVVSEFALEGNGSDRILLVYFSIFSPDAAQVLLKALEEPDEHTTVILMTPYPYIVPLTIRSRVVLLQTERTTQAVETVKYTRTEAFAYIKKELSSDSDEDAATRRALAVKFLDELEIASKDDPRKAQAIYEGKHMLFHANLPTKFVMEYVVAAVL